jgi:hypothetical protein
MSTIVTRAGKGSPLTHNEVDANFTNLNTDKAGYITGEGGTVTQATSKATTVTLNKKCGQITMNGAALAAGTTVSFALYNSTIANTDLLVLNHHSGGTAGAYLLNAQCRTGFAGIDVRNVNGSSLSETIVIGFAVIKASIT